MIVNSTEENVQVQSVSNKNPGSTIVTVPEALQQNADANEHAPKNRADNETHGNNAALKPKMSEWLNNVVLQNFGNKMNHTQIGRRLIWDRLNIVISYSGKIRKKRFNVIKLV